MLQQLRTTLRDDYLAVIGLIAGFGQLGFVSTLFDLGTSTFQVYGISSIAVALMLFFVWKHRRQAYRERFHDAQAKTHQRLAILYVALSLAAASPAVYRFIFLHTLWLTPNHNPNAAPFSVGAIVDSFIPTAIAAEQNVKVNASLDTSRTSVRCMRASNQVVPSEEVFDWRTCKQFGVPETAMGRFLYGWKDEFPNDYEGRLNFERKYFTKIILPTRRALRSVPRLAQNPLLEGTEALIKFPNNFEWKQRLFNENLLPTPGEWSVLNRERPMEARALRTYLTELIGVLDPIFAVSIENNSNKPIEIASIKYTAKYVDTVLADLLSGYDRPRYVIELRDGTHTEPMNPPIVVPPNGIASFDLLLTLQTPRAGSVYEIDLGFGTRTDAIAASLPKTEFIFFKGKTP